MTRPRIPAILFLSTVILWSIGCTLNAWSIFVVGIFTFSIGVASLNSSNANRIGKKQEGNQ